MLELDGVFHQPGWTELPMKEFRRRVSEFVTESDGWVVDGNYSTVRDLVWGRADTVVWFDLPRYEVMRRLSWRTARRGVLRMELWNGNRETLRKLLQSRSRALDSRLGMDDSSSQPRAVQHGRAGSGLGTRGIRPHRFHRRPQVAASAYPLTSVS